MKAVRLLSDLSAYPFHAAVQACDGDIVQFCADVSTLSSPEVDANDLVPMELFNESTIRAVVCAAEYAYLLGYDGVGDVLTQLMSDPSQVVHHAPAMSVSNLGNIDDLEFATIVDESGGDVVQFQRYLSAIDMSNHSVAARFEVEIVTEERETVTWSAVEMASHLGYDTVVEYLVNKTCQHLPLKDRFALMDHAVAQAAKWAAVS